MRIAHITDLHVARAPSFGDYNAKRVLGYINYRLFRSRRYLEHIAERALARLMSGTHPPDAVLLTGDITQHGLETEFEAAERLLSVVTGRGVPVIAVPGNHDIYGQTNHDALWAMIRRLHRPLTPDTHGVFHLDGVEVLPLAQGIPTPPFFSHGRQNAQELERAGPAWLERPKDVMRLVCGHYPVIDPHGGRLVYFHGLREADKLVAFCGEHRVAGYFCGHNHKRFAAEMPGGCMQYAAPALSAVKNASTEWVSVYECEPGQKHPRDMGGQADQNTPGRPQPPR